LVSCCIFIFTLTAIGQVQNGQFEGTITDPSGAAISGAKVTITNMSTGLAVNATANQSGVYVAKELPPGTYKLTTEAPGFKTRADTNVTLNAGVIQRVDFKMEIGQTTTVVEVSGQASAVQTDDSKLATSISSTQIENLPLNGHNVYDLMQVAPGAVNVSGTDFEGGHSTVVNGLREDFNGFLINGVSNKDLSGGANNTPIQDSVEEFQQLQLNMSAQYGNSAGTVNNLVTKSGTNRIHGSIWEYVRNDKFDANDYFLNQQQVAKPELRFNQFGFTLGGPIVKDKLFFFAAYQGDRFITVAPPTTVTQESPQWRQAVLAADSNTGVNSVAGELYKNFAPSVAGSSVSATMNDYVQGGLSSSGFTSYVDYLCPDSYLSLGASSAQANALASRFASILGVLPTDNFSNVPFTGAGCSATPASQPGTIGRTAAGSSMPFQVNSVALFKTQTGALSTGNLFNGNEASLKLDFDPNANNRTFLEFNWWKQTDNYGPCSPACARGFTNPQKVYLPNLQFSFLHTFSPNVLNEVRAGYTLNKNLINTATPGVPSVAFDDGSLGFGSYSGYPQFFKDNIYSYSDMVSISHGNHNMKIGVDIRRNIENSQFNIARPSYYFNDPLFFAADSPYFVAAGVNPDLCTTPCTLPGGLNSNPNAALQTNIRHFRNIEFGGYFQDDWKVTKRLTLNLGVRYDLFTRHNELNDLATTFIPGPGNNLLSGMVNANVPAGSSGTIGGTSYDCMSTAAIALSTIAGVCGPGGFAPSSSLGKGDHNDWSPRLGFAYDVFGNGKTALRGGFGVSYEGTLYNPLSNSRWNPPYYSFDEEFNWLGGGNNDVLYGPSSCVGSGPTAVCSPAGGAQFGPGGMAPSYLGAGTNPNMGAGSQATGNIGGWDPSNPNFANLTGIVLPQGIRDPYVYNYYLGLQHEIMPKMVLEANFVGTTGHKLFRAENTNRYPGSVLPQGATYTDNFGRTWTGNDGYANSNYGAMRTWLNDVNSNYNSLQLSLKKQTSHGLLFNANYTYSHSIDNGSTWHSGATTANGAAAGEGYTLDWTEPQLDRGDSIFDIRHRLVLNYVWELPGKNMNGILGAILGGWSYDGVWALQSGAHWEPFISTGPRLSAGCSAIPFVAANCTNSGGDYNLDHGRNDRPNSNMAGFANESRSQWENGLCATGTSANPGATTSTCAATAGQPSVPLFSAPCLGCDSTLGRNTFVGPGMWSADMTLAKSFKITESMNLKFEASGFNVFNRANFVLATAGGGAHNKITDSQFGEAAGTLGARLLQLGLKLSF
jgi:hypothetical protein